jgi:hypothetical protein
MILAGSGNSVSSSVLNSVVIGGSGMTATSSNTVYVPSLNVGSVGSGTSVTNLGIDSTGKVISGSNINYKVYSALISQSSTSAPTVTIRENTLGYTPSLSRNIAGSYTIGVTGTTIPMYFITENTTNLNYDFRIGTGFSLGIYTIVINTYNSGVGTDGLLSNTPVEIRVYP